MEVVQKPWSVDAACRGVTPSIFYPDEHDVEGNRRALEICQKCPVRQDCLVDALERNEAYGVWGGAMPQERKYIRRYKLSLKQFLPSNCGTKMAAARHKIFNESCTKCRVKAKKL